MAVAIFITQIVIHSLREWGDDIRLEGAEATRREKALRQRRSGEVQHVREALYRRLEQVTKTGESLSPSNYLQPKKNNL
ncbi:MAG: hypothetical protein S4CHLAM45_07510 [Chlamydiales bacterium]|nr:hypothetical protein [Chlamydiales bacterium]MCH9620039.1 hypothetical protein [Chlamydiales bacterium]MCH9622858.1 hypothetical protein [Chlamydiales bacterium]